MIVAELKFVQCYNFVVPDFEAHDAIAVLVTDSPEQTQQLGERLGRLIQPGDVICLSGELGAGKTTLATGIGQGWGALETVNSPTFVFVNQYSRSDGQRLYHVDAYRLKDAGDVESIGLEDLLADQTGAVLLEWPERVRESLPTERLWIELDWIDDTRRQIRLSGNGRRYGELLRAWEVA